MEDSCIWVCNIDGMGTSCALDKSAFNTRMYGVPEDGEWNWRKHL